MLLLMSADHFCFEKNLFLKILSGTLSVSNSLNPDQYRHFVGSGLGPNCWSSADDKICCHKYFEIQFQMLQIKS